MEEKAQDDIYDKYIMGDLEVWIRQEIKIQSENCMRIGGVKKIIEERGKCLQIRWHERGTFRW